ncbi:MAG: DUF151 domain-containing protein [Rikenellaceae bacterium]|nr:DUF151 domain-containing protein [Rikenellaceae bacterium]
MKKEFIEIQIKEIIEDPDSNGCYRLVLEDTGQRLEIPIVISPLDARPLLTLTEGEPSLRPGTHELFAQFISATGYRLHHLKIHDFQRGIYYASLIFGRDGQEIFTLDCRPTDGVALALREGAPMYIGQEVIQRVGMLLYHDMGSMKLPQRIHVMEEKLKRLVEQERYEEAGILRDRINALKQEN